MGVGPVAQRGQGALGDLWCAVAATVDADDQLVEGLRLTEKGPYGPLGAGLLVEHGDERAQPVRSYDDGAALAHQT